MRNMYPKPCGVCQGRVPAGEGNVQGSHASGWTVTHDVCPRGSVRHGHAQAYARRVMGVLRRKESTATDISEALAGLAALMRTGWTSREGCEKVILRAPAFSDLDRLEVEEILNRSLSEEGTRC
jgi:hypothetical protein